jgi:hypothetical protein
MENYRKNAVTVQPLKIPDSKGKPDICTAISNTDLKIRHNENA